MINRIGLFCGALCIGLGLNSIRIPIPFLLGGIVAAILMKTTFVRYETTWPKPWRNLGLMIAGYGIGTNFSPESLQGMLQQCVGMLEATMSVLIVGAILGYMTSKILNEDLISCLLGMLPGGLILSMLLAESDKRVNPNVIVVMQILRLFGVVLTVPFLTIYFLGAQVTPETMAMPVKHGLSWLWCFPIMYGGKLVAEKLHVPVPVLMGPVLLTSLVAIKFGGIQTVPFFMMIPAQISLGLFMGLQLDVPRLMETKRVIPYVVVGTIIMIGISIVMSYTLSARYGFSLIDAFLGMAPGGVAEMCLAGLSMGADISIVLIYQLSRMLIINLSVPPIVQYVLKTLYKE